MAGTVTPRQARAIEAMLSGESQERAAQAAGVTSRTLRRWQSDRTFSDALHQAENERLSAVARRLLKLADKATVTLYAGMAGDATGTQIRAADLCLGHLSRLSELHDLAERMAEVERRLVVIDK